MNEHERRMKLAAELRYGKALHERKISGREHRGFVQAADKIYSGHPSGHPDNPSTHKRNHINSHDGHKPIHRRPYLHKYE
jgi:hypothetical protein